MKYQVLGTLLCVQLVAITTITVSARASHFDDQSEQQWLDAVKDLLRKYEGTACQLKLNNIHCPVCMQDPWCFSISIA